MADPVAAPPMPMQPSSPGVPEEATKGINVQALTKQGEEAYANVPSGDRRSIDIRARGGTNQFPQPPAGEPAPPAALPPDTKPTAAPVAPTKPVVQPKENDDLDPSVTGFLKWAWNGAKEGVESAVPQVLGQAAEGANILLGMPAARGTDAVIDLMHGHLPSSSGSHATQNIVGDWYNKELKPAIDAWEPQPGNPIAAGAQGGTMLALTKIPGVGQASGAAMAVGTFTRSLTNSLDEGKSASAALGNATVDSAAMLATMLLIGKEGPGMSQIPYAWLRRAITAVPGTALINMGQELAKTAIAQMTGEQKKAKDYGEAALNAVTDVGSYIQNEIFAILGGHPTLSQEHVNGPKPPEPAPVKGGGPTTPTAPKPIGETPPPPPEPKPVAAPATPPAPKPVEGATQKPSAAPAAPVVPDRPTGEPAKQIRAQLVDMNRHDTPRQGVLITAETQQHLDSLGQGHNQAGPVLNQLEQARKQGRTVDTPQGELVLKTKALAAGARAELNAGKDPQEVIGRVTIGAEGPKRPDQQIVVQHLEPHDGTITSEKAVNVNERDPEIQKALDSGKVPRVVTPDHVIAERAEGIAKESPTPGVDTAHPEIAAPEPSQKPASVKPGFFKPEHGEEVPVHVLEDGRIQRLDNKGEPTGEPMQAPEGSVRTGPREPGARQEAPPEPVKGTALQQLPGVIEAHERMEAVPEGRKKATSLKERQDNASAVAEALQQAANEAHEKGSASPAAIERATAAAKAAKGLTNISKENTEKGRGTGHVQVTAKVNEMHKAARELLGKARPGDEVRESPKEAVKRAQLAKASAKAKPEGGDEATEKLFEEAVKRDTEAAHEADRKNGGKTKGELLKERAEKVADTVVEAVKEGAKEAAKQANQKKEEKPEKPEPKTISRNDRKLVDQMSQGYLRAKTPEGARRRREELEEHLRAVADKLGQPHDHVMELLEDLDRRRGEGRPKMSDTLEDEQHEFERPETGFDTVYRPHVGGDKAGAGEWNRATLKLKEEYGTLGNELESRGFFKALRDLEDTGRSVSSKRVLETLIRHAEDAHMANNPIAIMARHILAKMPDVPLFSRSTIIRPPTGSSFGEGTVGLFHGSAEHPNVQIKFGGGRSPSAVLHTLLHELEHSATMLELLHNPHGELATQARAARDILESRMRELFGDVAISQHLAYFRDTKNEVDKPADFHPEWYGLQDEKEMMAELVNPMFVEHIIHSEMVARASENLPKSRGVPGLLHKIYQAVSKFFGYPPDTGPRLLMHILDIDRELAQAQQGRFARFYEAGSYERQKVNFPEQYTENLARLPQIEFGRGQADPFGELKRPSPTIKAEDPSRNIVGDEGVKTAKDTLHAIGSGAVEKVRRGITALETVGQILRTKTRYFGHEDDPTNPLNQYRDALTEKEKAIMEGKHISNPVAKAWMRLNNESNRRVGQLMIDAGLYHISPRVASRLSVEDLEKRSPQYRKQYDELVRRYEALTPEERNVYDGAAKANAEMRAVERRTAIDSAIEGFDLKVTPGERAQLYGVKHAEDYDNLIGKGKLLDFADKNDKLKAALKEWAGGHDVEGDYFHMGRQGNYVVQAKPEGTKEFGSKEEAERWADTAKNMSPNSKAEVEERGGKWVVDYKVDHVSMHKTRAEAEKMRDQLDRAGFEPGSVTEKNFDASNAPLSQGMTELIAEATRKLNRGGNPADVQPLVDSLHSAFLQMQAQRSAFAGSRLMRKGVGGVKASEMRQNFAEHATASMWHSAQLRTVFKQAVALGRLRQAARDSSVPQGVAYQRGETVNALASHAALDAQSFGRFAGFNRQAARAGFLSYLASPAHAAIWMTQNAYGIARAGAKYGYGRASLAFGHGMAATFSPAMRSAMRAAFKGGTSDDITDALVKSIRENPKTAKWADAIQELHDRGVIQHGYANELGELSQGGNNKVSRAMEWARLLPSMADAFNRTSTALAGLELTGGDLRKTTDLIEEIHADYSSANKPLAFKYAGRVPGGQSLTMMKTYVQSMAHLFYSNLAATVTGETKAAKWEAAKTVAGMMVASTLFAGVYGAIGLEPVRLIAYAYHKLFDEEGEVWDMKNAVHHWLVDHLGATAGNALARGPIAAALGVDVQDRMGLANLFFFNPPDLLTTDKSVWGTFFMDELGPLAQMVVDGVTEATGHIQNGEYAEAIASVVPIKVVKDGLKALQLGTTGKTNIRGAVQTEPSALDAAKQVFGLKPANVAAAQEKAGVMAEYSKAEGVARTNIIRALAGGKDGAVERMQSFNSRFPDRRITMSEVRSYQRGTLKQEEGISKDRRAVEASDFSGR